MISKSKGEDITTAQFDQSTHDVAHSRIWRTDTTKKSKIGNWSSAKDLPKLVGNELKWGGNRAYK